MDNKIQVSVIIVNWNGKHLLEECLNALSKQTLKNFETILVDNGSIDNSVQFVRQSYPWVRIVVLPENKGYCYANNLGYAASKGAFVALLNNDTVVEPDWLYCLLNQIISDERIGICASQIVRYDNQNILDTAGDGYDICGVGFRRGHGENRDLFTQCEDVFGACAAAAIYRKSMVDDIGFFDDSFFAIGEDIDLSFRAKISGYRCLYVPEAIVKHKISETIGIGSDFQLYQSRRNVEYVYIKNMPLALIFLTFPIHLLYNLVTFAQALILGKIRVYIKSKYDFLNNINNILAKRKRIQKKRKISLKYLLSTFSKDYIYRRSIRAIIKSISQ